MQHAHTHSMYRMHAMLIRACGTGGAIYRVPQPTLAVTNQFRFTTLLCFDAARACNVGRGCPYSDFECIPCIILIVYLQIKFCIGVIGAIAQLFLAGIEKSGPGGPEN